MLRRELGPSTELAMKSFLQEIRDEGVAEGEAKGQAKLFLTQLEARFGPLPADVTRRVREAKPEELEVWAVRVLSAQTLESLFA